MSSSTSELGELMGVTTYIPATLTGIGLVPSKAIMVETEDYELSGCYVKFTDYEELRSMYLDLKFRIDSLEK